MIRFDDVRMLALPRDVELDVGTAEVFGAVLRNDSVCYELAVEEYPVLLQLCGARRRQGSISLPADVSPFVDNLIAQGVAVVVPQGAQASIVPEQQVSLVPGLELRSAIFVVVDAREQPVGLVNTIGSAILDACDGRRSVADLSLPGGFEPSDVTTELTYLQTSGFVEVLPPSMTLRRNVLVRRPADSFVAVPLHGDKKYLLTGDEVELLGRCGSPQRVRELLNGSTNDAQWILAVLSRAAVLGLVTMSTPRGAARTIARTPSSGMARVPVPARPATRPPTDDMDFPTTVEVSSDLLHSLEPGVDPFGDVAPPYVPPSPAPALSADSAVKLGSLESLSLHKGAVEPVAERSSSKLPWILLVLVLIGGGYYQFRTAHETAAPAAAAAAEPPKSDPKPPVAAGALLASGYIAAKDPIVLSTTVSGRVGDVKVANNDSIKKGQILATIDDGDARAELRLAYARINDAQRSLQRTKMLIKAQAATPAELDHAVGQVEIASAQATVIKQKIEDMKIRSPIDGTVLEVVARTGEALTAGPGQGVVVKVADLRALCAEIDVDQGEIKRVFMHQAAEVIADAQKGQTYKGTVYEISQQADKARGTVLVRVDIAVTPDSVLKPGMAVQVSFIPKTP